MRVLVVSVNRLRQPFPVMPFGACLVAQSARRAGHQVRFLDLMWKKNFIEALAREVQDFKPEVVGMSIRNIDANDASSPVALSDEAVLLTETIRKYSNAIIVLGGAAMGVMPRQLLQRTGASLAVQADGDVIFPKVLDAISRGQDPGLIGGVLCPDRPAARQHAPMECTPTDCTVEDFSQWIDVRAYKTVMTAAPVQAKRGCPFECVYCTYNLAEGRGYRLHSPEHVVQSVSRLASQGIRDIEFVDAVFNSPYDHALAICRQLAAAKLRVRLQTLDMNPRFLDDNLLTSMEQAGFAGIGITVDSHADAVLSAMQKGYGTAEVERAMDTVNRHPMPCMWIFLLGGPGETRDTVKQTLDFAAKRIRPTDVAFFQTGVRIYPGTPLDKIARAEGVLSLSADEMLPPVFYHSPHVPSDWLQAQLTAVAKDNLNFVAENAVSVPALQTMLRLAYLFGVRPPVWRRTKLMRRMLKWL